MDLEFATAVIRAYLNMTTWIETMFRDEILKCVLHDESRGFNSEEVRKYCGPVLHAASCDRLHLYNLKLSHIEGVRRQNCTNFFAANEPKVRLTIAFSLLGLCGSFEYAMKAGKKPYAVSRFPPHETSDNRSSQGTFTQTSKDSFLEFWMRFDDNKNLTLGDASIGNLKDPPLVTAKHTYKYRKPFDDHDSTAEADDDLATRLIPHTALNDSLATAMIGVLQKKLGV
jgi:hypothetical protein